MRAYRAKMVESIRLPDREEREAALDAAGHNVFNLDSDAVYVDLLTDSGTGTMSDAQWAAMMQGDEAYAGSGSFTDLEAAASDVLGFDRIVPAHQGRGAENVLYGSLVEPGDVVPNNTHFDTTRAHVVEQGGEPVDCPVEGALDPGASGDFLGNFDVERARAVVDEVGADRVPAVVVTLTNNSAAGQPVSVANVRAVREFCDEIGATFVLDACRFAENAHFVREREPEFADSTVAAVAREQLSYADACIVSAKKDGLANVGGFVGIRDAPAFDDLFERAKQRAILYEGFTTYGGMAGRDLAAVAVGLREAVTDAYITDRVEQVRWLGERLDEAGVPVVRPVGGHAVYVDAGAMCPHLRSEEFPGQAVVCDLYREGGVRGVELGEFAFPGADRPDLVRLAIPRRTYARDHLEHVVETAAAVADHADDLPGYEVVSEPPMAELRHFSADLRPLAPSPGSEE
ncbi:tryptophanase [Haloglomus litoreum]|uniref:tryptophanase n=1 Tax=Haloglomus litoreum TaxID=3034026 RepID=UPI0023E87F61|nr:tryptophanase [Haloglomus sp. DT116]